MVTPTAALPVPTCLACFNSTSVPLTGLRFHPVLPSCASILHGCTDSTATQLNLQAHISAGNAYAAREGGARRARTAQDKEATLRILLSCAEELE